MKTCPECSQPVTGRADKKFCSELCRNIHNNDKTKSIPFKNLHAVNSILKKNRHILEKLNAQGLKKVSKEQLLRLDFNFYYFTHIHSGRKGTDCFFCYDYGYYPAGDNCCKLVTQQPG